MSQTLKSPNRKPRWRAAHRRALRERGPVPEQQRVFLVEPTALPEIPEWAEKRRVKGLGSMQGQIWLFLSPARHLMRLDREAGGTPRHVEVEFKRCLVCSRPLIASQAEGYRKQLEAGDRSLPCGKDCAQARDLKIYAA